MREFIWIKCGTKHIAQNLPNGKVLYSAILVLPLKFLRIPGADSNF